MKWRGKFTPNCLFNLRKVRRDICTTRYPNGPSGARMVTFWARVAGQDGAYLWYAPCPVPAPRYAKRDRTDKCGTLSRYVPASDRGDDAGQEWDIVPPCPAKRPRDGAGQVGDVVPACPARHQPCRTWPTCCRCPQRRSGDAMEFQISVTLGGGETMPPETVDAIDELLTGVSEELRLKA